MPDSSTLPVVLSIAGHDPSGGAGVQADIEAIVANGCRASSALTCLTVQDTRRLSRLVPVEPDLLEQQINGVLGDLPVAAIKIGALCTKKIGLRVARLLRTLALPIILDPVLASGTGTLMSDSSLRAILVEQLLPLCWMATPNLAEAGTLSGISSSVQASAERLLHSGCAHLLITDVEPDSDRVVNLLFSPDGLLDRASWPRLGALYHGSGCTLAAAVAAGCARGLSAVEAARHAQAYTWNSLAAGERVGQGQKLPDRLFQLHADKPEQ